MSVSDDASSETRLAALSHRLGIPARQLLIAAARLADSKFTNDPAYRERVLRDARNEIPSAEAAALLLLTPMPDYSINEVDRLFASIWPQSAERQDA